MKFSHHDRKAISPIIATLLLIAIAVAAGIIVYVFVNGLAGNLTGSSGAQVTQQLQVQAYAFLPASASGFTSGGTSGSGQLVDIFLKNVGGGSLTISGAYLDGTPLTEWGTTASGTYGSAVNYQVPTSGSSCYLLIPTGTAISGVSTTASTNVAGATSGCVGNASTCTSPSFCLTFGSAPAETGGSAGSPIAAQGTAQMIIGLNTAQTQASSHTVKVISSTGSQFVFTVVVGRTG